MANESEIRQETFRKNEIKGAGNPRRRYGARDVETLCVGRFPGAIRPGLKPRRFETTFRIDAAIVMVTWVTTTIAGPVVHRVGFLKMKNVSGCMRFPRT